MKIEVVEGVGVPEGRLEFPYRGMEVGESFCLPYGMRQRVYNANWRAARRLGHKYRTEKRREDGQLVIRTWRVE